MTYNNIFVLGTGRCGTMTFIKACSHITNYTSAHESRTGILGAHRLDYPTNHIEADNRLSWFLGRLDRKYGSEAFYVHLIRHREATAASYAKRVAFGIMHSYKNGIYIPTPQATPLQTALDLWDTINSNITTFLKDKPSKITIHLEDPKPLFTRFWKLIDAEGDISTSLAEWDTKWNAS